MDDEQFYSVSRYGDRLRSGEKLTIEHSLLFSSAKADLAPLVKKSEAQLDDLIAKSEAKEDEMFRQLCMEVTKWEKQGAKTMLLRKALEYVKTPIVTHTANVWKTLDHNRHECSNMVYKMTYQIYEDTKYDRTLKKSVPVAWEVRWSVGFNMPSKRNPYSYYSSASTEIAGQERKRYMDKAAAEKYIQGRIAAYAKLFQEISPPIPEDKVKLFSVNGHLLPGYTVQPHVPTPDELLIFLDDADLHEEGKALPKPKTPQRTAPKKGSISR